MWDLIYLLACSSSPNPKAIEHVLDGCGFEENLDQPPLLKIKGAEKDFALMTLFLIVRQIAVADVLPGEIPCVCMQASCVLVEHLGCMCMQASCVLV